MINVYQQCRFQASSYTIITTSFRVAHLPHYIEVAGWHKRHENLLFSAAKKYTSMWPESHPPCWCKDYRLVEVELRKNHKQKNCRGKTIWNSFKPNRFSTALFPIAHSILAVISFSCQPWRCVFFFLLCFCRAFSQLKVGNSREINDPSCMRWLYNDWRSTSSTLNAKTFAPKGNKNQLCTSWLKLMIHCKNVVV